MMHFTMNIDKPFLTVREIPELTARAIYPAAIAGRVVTGILKQSCEDSMPASRPVPLDDAEMATVGAIWAHLPTISFPLHELQWWRYADAFEHAGHPPTWRIHPLWSGADHNQSILRLSLEQEHAAQLSAAIERGEIQARNPLTFLAENFTVGDAGLDALVSDDDVIKFAAMMGIEATKDTNEAAAINEDITAQAPPVTEHGRETKPEAEVTTGVPADAIIEKFHLDKKWDNRLRHRNNYSYLKPPVLAQPGARGNGKGCNLWNPAQFAKMLLQKEKKNMTAMNTTIENHFQEWIDEWREISGWNDV